MASVHRRPTSKYWHAAWRAVDGTLILRSTKQSNRAKALAFALECERAEKLAGANTLTEAQARDIIKDIMTRCGSDEILRSPSTREYFKEWLASKETITADGTAARYSKAVKEFLNSLGDRADKPLSNLTARHVERFVTERTKAGLSPTTVTLDAKVVRTALNRARRQGLIPINPAEAVDLPGNDSVERGIFSSAEIKMLLAEAEGEWKTLILLAYFTGARLSDCCRMEWGSVDLTQGTLRYRQSKTRKPVLVPIHGDLQKHLEELASTDSAQQWIMPGMADKGPGGRHGLSESFKRIVRKAGLDLQTVPGSGIRQISRRTFHALRHSFTSALANAQVAPELRMKLTGHSSDAIHRGYTHHELATLRDAVEKLPSLKA